MTNLIQIIVSACFIGRACQYISNLVFVGSMGKNSNLVPALQAGASLWHYNFFTPCDESDNGAGW